MSENNGIEIREIGKGARIVTTVGVPSSGREYVERLKQSIPLPPAKAAERPKRSKG